MPERQSFGQWWANNFDKVLLLGLYVGLLVFVLHMTHDHQDKDNIAWGREAAGTVLGALLGLIQGARVGAAWAMRNISPAPTPPPAIPDVSAPTPPAAPPGA